MSTLTNQSPPVSRATSFVLLGLIAASTFAQSPPSPRRDEETVRLDQFTVSSSTEDDGYLTTQSLGNGRVRTPIMQMPGSIQIINRNVIDDIGALRVLDAAKLVSGVTEGTIPNSVERYMMRGISGDIRLIDGFTAFDQANTDSVNIERLEVIKGPSSLLFANGPVGGLINQITKSPLAATRRSVTAQVGLFDTNRVEIDLTGPINASKSLLYRLVGLHQDGDSFWDHTQSKRDLLAPSFTYLISPTTSVTLKAEYFYNEVGGYNGVPYDFATGRIVPVPADTNLSVTTDDNFLRSHRRTIFGQFTSQLSEVFAMRVAARGQSSYSDEFDLIGVAPPAFSSAGGNRTFLRRIDAPDYNFSRWSLQNDYVANFNTTRHARHSVVAGWDISNFYQKTFRELGPVNLPIDIYNPVAQPAGPVTAASTTNTLSRTDTWKAFALEQLFLLDDRLILSGGLVRTHYEVLGRNLVNNANTSFIEGYQTTKQGGIVYRPTPEYSVYYTYNENFQPGGVSQGILLPNQVGKQNEVGVKTLLMKDKLSFSVAYYDIQITNATQLSTTATGPVVVALPNSTSRGWEFDFNATLRPGWNAIAAFSTNLSRSGAGIQNRGAPRRMASLWNSYRLRDGQFKGVGFAAGLSYLADRPGDFADSFRIKGYTLANGAVYYEAKSYRIALNVENAFDKFHAVASINSNRVYLGPTRNLRLTGTYKF